MAIALRVGSSSWTELTADGSVAIPATPQTGDRVFLFASWKDYSVTATVSGWTEVTEWADGTTGSGNGTGSMKVGCWYKDYTGAGDPTIDFSSDPNIAQAAILVMYKGAGEEFLTPGYVTAALSWGSGSTTTSASSTISVPTGGAVMAICGIRDDSATFTRGTNGLDAVSGVTWNGNYAEMPTTHASTTTAQDMSADLGYRLVTTGGTGITLRVTGTLSNTETGAALWVVQGVQVATSANAGVATATGSASTSSEKIEQPTGAASATGSAYGATGQPGVAVTAGVATGSASAAGSSESILQTAGFATSTGAANTSSHGIGQTAGVAISTGTANATSHGVGYAVGEATATGTANTSSHGVGQTAGSATASGSADTTSQAIEQPAGVATATGLGYDATAGVPSGITWGNWSDTWSNAVSSESATAGIATATGEAYVASVTIGQTAALAAATGAAADASVLAYPNVYATAGAATATGAAEWGGGGGTVGQDTFTEAGSGTAALTTHTPETGTAWTEDEAGPAGGALIDKTNDRASTPIPVEFSGEWGGGMYVVSPDITGEVDVYLTTDDAYFAGPIVRRVNSSTYYRVGAYGTQVLLYRVTSGVQTQIGSTTKSSGSTRIRLNVSGVSPTTLKVKAWASAGSEPGPWGIDTTDNTAANQNATGKVGVYVASYDDGEGLIGAATVDDFLATTPGGGSAVGPSVAIGQPAGSAAATGTTPGTNEAIGQPAGIATATGSAATAPASVGPTTIVATATGSALDASYETVSSGAAYPGCATGTGEAYGSSTSVGQTIVLATGTGLANGATVTIGATNTLATSAGSAWGASVSIEQPAGVATATGVAIDATAQTSSAGTATADIAVAVGAAYNATVSAVSAAVDTGGVGRPKPTWYGPMVKEHPEVVALAGVAVARGAAHQAGNDIFMDEANFLLGLTEEALLLGVC